MSTNRKTNVPFSGTPEQEKRLREAIAEYQGMKGAMIPVLQKAQDIYGYLPIEVQKIISDEMQISLEEIYGIVSFYAQFYLNPQGKNKISCCLGTACYVKGASEHYKHISDKLGIKSGECTHDGKFSLEACRCIGACGLAPVLMINGTAHGRLTPEKVDQILAEY
jgi:NADP-reducing hydrogenase subunit HndA